MDRENIFLHSAPRARYPVVLCPGHRFCPLPFLSSILLSCVGGGWKVTTSTWVCYLSGVMSSDRAMEIIPASPEDPCGFGLFFHLTEKGLLSYSQCLHRSCGWVFRSWMFLQRCCFTLDIVLDWTPAFFEPDLHPPHLYRMVMNVHLRGLGWHDILRSLQ